MVHYKTGDLLRAEVDALVNTVNCVGIMGKGIALQFKKAFPDNFKAYATACKVKQVKLGEMFIYHAGDLIKPYYIVNFPTKDHWKSKSNLLDIQTGLQSLVKWVNDNQIKSIAIPPLGAGLGGLPWSQVKLEIEHAFEVCPDVEVWVYPPQQALAAQDMLVNTKKPKMTVGRAELIMLLALYQEQGYKHTLLEIQKLMYFMQETGEPLKLNYQKHFYGPYAENLKHVLQHIEGHYIKGYGDGTSRPFDSQIELMPEAEVLAEKCLSEYPASLENLQKVASLIKGFESPYGMELLSTVHWVVKQKRPKDVDTVVRLVYEWNARKKKIMQDAHIRKTYQVLQQRGWL